MAECEWAILCDYAFLDMGHKACLIGVFDRIFTPQVPAKHHQAALALKIMGEPGEKVQVKVEIIRPTGGPLATLGGEVVLVETGTAELQLNLGDMPLPDYGVYAFNIFLSDQLAKAVTFMVMTPPKLPTIQ